MKIIFHLPRLSYRIGGAESFARLLLRQLSRDEQYELILSTGANPAEHFSAFLNDLSGTVSYYPLIRSTSGPMRVLRRVLPEIPLYRRWYSPQYYWDLESVSFNAFACSKYARQEYDALFTQYYMNLWKMPADKPIIFRFTGAHSFKGATRLLQKASHYVVPCAYMRQQVLDYHGIEAKIIPTPVDTERFHPDATVEKKWDCLFVGRLYPNKGVATVLELVQRLPDVKFACIGDGPMRSVVEQAASECDNLSYVGVIPPNDMPGYYAASRLCLAPSTSDPFPNVVLEAMASGIPVIASRVGGIPEALKNSQDLLAQPDDIEGFASIISRLMRDDALCHDVGNTLRNDCCVRYAIEHIMKQWKDCFQQCR